QRGTRQRRERRRRARSPPARGRAARSVHVQSRRSCSHARRQHADPRDGRAGPARGGIAPGRARLHEHADGRTPRGHAARHRPAPDTDFTAKLVDVRPDGFAQNLADGIVRARYRNSRTAPALLTPDEVAAFTIDLWATSHVFLPGHRIRLEISSSNFPRFDRNLNTGERFGEGTKGLPAQQTMFHQDDKASYLLLPVIPR